MCIRSTWTWISFSIPPRISCRGRRQSISYACRLFTFVSRLLLVVCARLPTAHFVRAASSVSTIDFRSISLPFCLRSECSNGDLLLQLVGRMHSEVCARRACTRTGYGWIMDARMVVEIGNNLCGNRINKEFKLRIAYTLFGFYSSFVEMPPTNSELICCSN